MTGGVVSGIGKGITAASVGLILKSAGYSVDVIKFDPYLNIDPGTMSPFEHGEVYVLDDGSETDLDLGHYERFLDVNLTGISSVTAGKIYNKILEREREGSYLGKNVQLIPHVTNYIKECFARDAEADIRLIEIGGSTGDMEGEIFLESFRQFKQEHRSDVFHIHLGYIPYLACSGEYKTKPMQNSIRELLRAGLQPDAIIIRSDATEARPLESNIFEKIALFSNLPSDHVISLTDQDSIYKVPLALVNSDMSICLEGFLGQKLEIKLPDFFHKFAENRTSWPTVKIALISKYTKLGDSYLSVIESLKIAGVNQGLKVEVSLIDSESDDIEQQIDKVDGVIVPGGFGRRGMEGKIRAIQHIRENKKPFLGICLGLQMAVVEYARNKCGLSQSVSSEMVEDRSELEGKDVLIDFMPEQLDILKKGGTMRLGGYDCTLMPNTLVQELYGKSEIRERHRHRLEVQSAYVQKLQESGLNISGRYYFNTEHQLDVSKDQFLVELIELDQDIHPYFVATQSHPEFLSRPTNPHPLFSGLVATAHKLKSENQN